MTGVIGLDLSLASTGLAFAEDGRIESGYTINTRGKKGDDLATRRRRVNGMILQPIMGAVDDFYPDLVVVEAPSYGSQHGAQHDRSGLWWLVVDALFDLDCPVATVSPSGRAKYATGKGNAPKDAVLAAVVRRYSSDAFEIADNNLADAVALAAMGSRHLGQPVEDSLLPQTHLLAMEGAAWPTPAN